jgi:hypothetical protein
VNDVVFGGAANSRLQFLPTVGPGMCALKDAGWALAFVLALSEEHTFSTSGSSASHVVFFSGAWSSTTPVR